MLELEAGDLHARIVPEAGGIIAALDWRGPDGRLHKLLHAPDGAVPSTAAPNMFGQLGDGALRQPRLRRRSSTMASSRFPVAAQQCARRRQYPRLRLAVRLGRPAV